MNPSTPPLDDGRSVPQPSGQDSTRAGPDAGKSGNPLTGGEASSPFTFPSVQLPKGGGGIKGIGDKFSVSPATGTGNFTVPIKTSNGRAGSSVALSLSYNSGAGNGSFGLGWQLSNQSIVRKTDKGLPQYRDEAESDVFMLSGAEDLVPYLEVLPDGTSHSAPETRHDEGKTLRITRYRPRMDNGAIRILAISNQETGDTYWEVKTGGNVTTIYGDCDDSRVFDPLRPSRVFEWLPTRSYDDKGNETLYQYKREDSCGVATNSLSEQQRSDRERSAARYIKRIKYGNTISNLNPTFKKNNSWLFEIVFDYGEHDHEHPSAVECKRWPVRPDPFSTRRSGFEVRSYRLCRRVLMFHHFPDEPAIGRDCLVDSFNVTYDAVGQDPSTRLAAASIVSSVIQQSWQRCGDAYKKQSMPPLEFRYSAAQPAKQSETLESASLANLPAGFSGDYQVIDLEGQGLPGVVLSVDGNLSYMANLGNGHFGLAEALPSSPGAGIRSDARQWMDLSGGGKLNLVQMNASNPGFYKRNSDQDSGWDMFRAFQSFPNVDMRDKNLKFIDLTGDGIADIVIIDDNELRFYPGLGDAGFGTPYYKPSPLDDETFTGRLLFWDGFEAIYTSDMTGDGLVDLVRVRNSEVCYWPNLGYGEFGHKVVMVNSPVFDMPDLFNQNYLLLNDIDGSGTTDIVYVGSDVPMIYHNLSGNGWSDGIPIPGFPGVNSATNVQVSDLLGRGTGCLVWSSTLPPDVGSQIRYLDLMEAGKPYLLVGIDNNMGWETRITYESSCQFYARDRRSGRPWTAHLPFPVHCVEKAELIDNIGKNLFTTKYAYHDGYFDGAEREFRGFGMVESWDTEFYSSLQQDDNTSNINKQSNMPPVLTKTWYHTGEYLNGQLVTRYADVPYWTGDDHMRSYESLTDPVLPCSITTKYNEIPYTLNHQERRESCRALRGQMLRSESYAIDGTELQGFPYIVQEANMHLELRQPVGKNLHSVLFVRGKESFEMTYDRSRYRVGSSLQFDPRISHTMVLETDFYGNELKSLAIAYGRRHADTDKLLTEDDRQAQMRSHAVLATAALTNSIETMETYLLPLPSQSQSYEIVNIDSCRRRSHRDAKEAVVFEDALHIIERLASGAFDIPFESFTGPYPSKKTVYRRLLKESCLIYRKDDLSGPLPLGVAESLSIPWRNFQLSLTDDQALRYVHSGKIKPNELDKYLSNECNFARVAGKKGWWAPSGKAFFVAVREATPTEELEEAKTHFFTVRRSRPQFDRESAPAEVHYDYDKYDLLIEEVRDPYGNRVTAGERNIDPSLPLVKTGNDYRLLAPFLVMDSNRNRSGAVFDVLGNVVASAAMGKPEENLGDSLDGVNPILDEDETREFFNDPIGLSNKYLGKATTRTVYDFFSYYRTRHHKQPQPNWISSLTRERHESDLPANGKSRVVVTLSYSDGLGRDIQTNAQCEPGPLTASVGAALGHANAAAPPPRVQKRWLTSSWVLFNNKNKPIRQYEPFFRKSHEFQDKAIHGVSSVLLYDAIGRPIAVVSPDHTWTKVKHDPWGAEQWDKIDTVLIEDPSKDEDVGCFFRLLPRKDYTPTWYGQRCNGQLGALEREAATQSALLANTPSSVRLDSLGRPCVSFEVLRNPQPPNSSSGAKDQVLRQPTFLDVQGLPTKLEDALGRETARSMYAIGGWVMSETHMDNGTKWTLPDVSGIPVLTWNARGQRFRTEYDRKRRIIGLHVCEGDKESLVEVGVYGETRPDLDLYNANGRIVLAYDQSGITRTPKYDFKGNLRQSTRQLACDYKGTLDWSCFPPPALQNEEFVEKVSYDAMGKPTETTLPDGTKTSYQYNERGMIRRVETTRNVLATVEVVIDDIEYDAKGQRNKIRQGNGVHTLFDYDKNTFHVRRIQTVRARKRTQNTPKIPSQSGSSSESDDAAQQRREPSHRKRREHIQDLNYVFDALGNITHATDNASQPIYFRNHRVEASQTFKYDSLARLVEATGREHIGQMHMARDRHSASYSTPSADGRVDHANDSKAMGRYVEKYVYDSVNNIQSLHHSNMTDSLSYTRRYYYEEKSLVDSSQRNNRLSRTSIGDVIEVYHYDGPETEPGNMTSMPGLPHMAYDYGERMIGSVQTLGKGSQARETIYYRYDTTGKRIRKVVERQTESEKANILKETIYIGGAFEVFRKYSGNGDILVEVHSLRISESGRQLLLIENRTLGGDNRAPGLVFRYQLGNFQGSAMVEVDQDANILSYEEYTPYGMSSVSGIFRQMEVPKRYRFLGKERDETGLYHLGLRYYAPWLGRFVSADPKGAADGSNLYQYAHGNPNMLTDPSGTNADIPSELRGWQEKDIEAMIKDQRHRENLIAKGGGAIIQQYRIDGRAAAGDFAKFLQTSIAEGGDISVRFETYLANAKTGGVKGSSYIDFILDEWKLAYEHKLLNFSKYSKDGSLVLSKVKDASSRIITQLNKHTTNLAQFSDDYGKVRLAVTLRGLDGATEQSVADFVDEFGRIMRKAGQYEPWILRFDHPGLVSASNTLQAGIKTLISTGHRLAGPLSLVAGAVAISGQVQAATGTGAHKDIKKSEQAQAGMDLAANVTGIGTFGVGLKAAAITATGGATLAAGAAVVMASAAAGGASAGAALGGWVDQKVENSEWAQQNLGPVGAGLAGYGTGVLAGAAAGAAVGALVGSVLPVVGTATGAVIGGAAGALGAEAKILITMFYN